MNGRKYLNEAQWDAAVKASLISPEIALGFDPNESFEDAYRTMPAAELEREAVSSGFHTNGFHTKQSGGDVKRFVGKVLGSFGTNNAPVFLESSGVGLEDVVMALGIKNLGELENLGYTPGVLSGLGYHVRFGDEGRIEGIYRKLSHECIQCYPKV